MQTVINSQKEKLSFLSQLLILQVNYTTEIQVQSSNFEFSILQNFEINKNDDNNLKGT